MAFLHRAFRHRKGNYLRGVALIWDSHRNYVQAELVIASLRFALCRRSNLDHKDFFLVFVEVLVRQTVDLHPSALHCPAGWRRDRKGYQDCPTVERSAAHVLCLELQGCAPLAIKLGVGHALGCSYLTVSRHGKLLRTLVSAAVSAA